MNDLDEDFRDCKRLFEQYQKPLLGFLRSFYASYHDAEDIAQEVWLEVSDRINKSIKCGGFDSNKGSFYTWITQCVAKYKALDWKRKKAKYREHSGILDGNEDKNEWAEDTRPTYREAQAIVHEKEELYQKHLAFCELFRLLFLCGGYPHEQLAYGFAKLIYGKVSRRSIEGRARKVDDRFKDKELRIVADCFWNEYKIVYRATNGLKLLFPSLKPLNRRLDYHVGELMQDLPEELNRIKDEFVAHTNLRDYFIKESERKTHPISDWCYRVEERLRRLIGLDKGIGIENGIENIDWAVQRDLGKSSACSQCKLRHLEPCVTRRSTNRDTPLSI